MHIDIIRRSCFVGSSQYPRLLWYIVLKSASLKEHQGVRKVLNPENKLRTVNLILVGLKVKGK